MRANACCWDCDEDVEDAGADDAGALLTPLEENVVVGGRADALLLLLVEFSPFRIRTWFS